MPPDQPSHLGPPEGEREVPTARQLVRSTLYAVVIAGALLVTCVLPAEYGIDPTGIGRRIGLTQMGETKRALAEEAAAAAEASAAADAAAASVEQSSEPSGDATALGHGTFLAVIAEELQRHPSSGLADLYTFAYHAAMGAEHSGMDETAARTWLAREVAALGAAQTWPESLRAEPLLESLTPSGDLVRVNLRPFIVNGGDLGALAAAFTKTANEVVPSREHLEQYWRELEDGAERGSIPFARDSLATYFARQRALGFPTVEHSAAYLAAYRPAYRVVRRALVPRVDE